MNLIILSIVFLHLLIFLWEVEADFLTLLEKRRNLEKLKNSACGKRYPVQGAIYGGSKVNDRLKWPWIVAFTKNTDKYFCGGSLITNQHVLSAAHCFQNKEQVEIVPARILTAYLGKFDLDNAYEQHSESSRITQIIIHPDWKPDHLSYDADIAIVVLRDKIEFTPHIRPVCLPPRSDSEVTGSGTVVGWGLSNNSVESGTHEKTPIELQIPAINASHCYTRFHDLVYASSTRMFCGGYDNQGKGPCSGDSGSGYYALNSYSSPSFVIQGIVSVAQVDNLKKCDVNKYSLFTNVGRFVDWIEEKTLQGDEESTPTPIPYSRLYTSRNGNDQIGSYGSSRFQDNIGFGNNVGNNKNFWRESISVNYSPSPPPSVSQSRRGFSQFNMNGNGPTFQHQSSSMPVPFNPGMFSSGSRDGSTTFNDQSQLDLHNQLLKFFSDQSQPEEQKISVTWNFGVHRQCGSCNSK